MRPLLHYVPARGWMNDPNGLIHWRGRHHLFYQHNPDGLESTNQHWGHASSPDLLGWTEHAVALGPGEPYDATACYSGCAVEHDGAVSILYTGVRGEAQLPCLAHAADDELSGFVKDQANPVVAGPPAPDVTEFRDHSVWRENGRWRQLVGGARGAHGGSVFGFSSTGLTGWTYDGVFLGRGDARVPGAVWECPDFFTVDGVATLVVSVIHEPGESGPDVWWLTGDDYGGRFTVRDCGVADVGDRFYAPQSYRTGDGRRMQFGWVRTHRDPFSSGGTTLGAMTLPRELSVRAGRLHCAPAAELTGLRRGVTTVPAGSPIAFTDARIAGELVLDAGARAVVLESGNGATMSVDLTPFAAADGPLRLFWDAGIVEVFRGGLAGTWTDLRIAEVTGLRVDGGADVWELACP